MDVKKARIGKAVLITIFAVVLVLLPIQFLNANGCVTTIWDSGFTATLVGGPTWSMPGSMAQGYLLCTNGDPDSEYHIQFAGDISPQTLDAKHFELNLVGSTVSALELEAYYEARNTPEP